ncbi:MAG TPA: hypothetical protein IAC79_04970 [Candidatus Spyradenecus faecavium]|uniref:Uncharacterized protein n=1 Tax=Candidatus Spyradenecus faecavium TaxID=2840947 RepID=A0A9D1T3M2_9BACT|nr:hypothetical protein [Candidatus Spyradenecus faecavium]
MTARFPCASSRKRANTSSNVMPIDSLLGYSPMIPYYWGRETADSAD